MILSEKERTKLIARSREAAGAILEDIPYLREIIANKKTSRGDVRRISTMLRRLLVYRDITIVAAPRMGKFQFKAPDNHPFYKIESDFPYEFFSSGGAPLFGTKLRPVMKRDGTWESIVREKHLLSDDVAAATVFLPLDGFLSQRVLCLNGQWASRGSVIKFVANVASAAHSTAPTEKDEILLAQIRNLVSVESDGTNTKLTIFGDPRPISDDFVYSPHTIDMVLHELLSVAYYLLESPDLVALEATLKAELSA